MELLSRLDYQQIGRRYVQSRAKKIDPAMVDVEGSNVNIVVAGSAFMAQAVTRQLADAVRSRSLLADGDDLDRYVQDVYGLPRKGAAGAVVPLQFARPTVTGGAGTLPVGTVVRTPDSIEYALTSAASFGATVKSGVTADARAVQAGFAFQVGANRITQFSNPGAIFDATITVNNAEPAAGGTDRELDPDYRERARKFWAAARRGTLAAIEQGALTVEGVESALADEPLTGGIPARIVTLVVADAAGVCNSALARRVVAALREYRAGGITVVVLSSVPQIVDVALQLYFATGVDTAALASEVQAAVVDFVNSLGAGQPLRKADIMTVLSRFRASGLLPVDGTIVEPAGDILPPYGRTLRTRPENVVLI